MPKYVVTGGADGLSGIEVAGKRYEPGEVVEIAAKKDWRIEAGYLELASTAKRARDDNGHFVPDDPATPDINEAFEPEAEPEPAPKKAGGK